VQANAPKAMTDRKPPARPRTRPASDAPPPRSQRDLVAASLLKTPGAERHWDERTRLEYRQRSR
jgi:hypothetical protein